LAQVAYDIAKGTRINRAFVHNFWKHHMGDCQKTYVLQNQTTIFSIIAP